MVPSRVVSPRDLPTFGRGWLPPVGSITSLLLITVLAGWGGSSGEAVSGPDPVPIQKVPSDMTRAVGAEAHYDDPVNLVGRLLDELSGDPVRGAIVRVLEQDREALSDGEGSFRFEGLEPGEWTLEVEHLGYGTQETALGLEAGVDAEISLRLSPRAITLESMEVPGRRAERDPFVRSSHLLGGEHLLRLEEQGSDVMTAVRRLGGGVRVSRETATSVCIESNRRILSPRHDEGSGFDDRCDMVTVVLDGMILHEGQDILFNLQLRDIESVQYLPPVDAGFRYGIDAGTVGALEIWTRGRGPHRTFERNP